MNVSGDDLPAIIGRKEEVTVRAFCLCSFVSVCALPVGLKDPLPQNTVFAAWES